MKRRYFIPLMIFVLGACGLAAAALLTLNQGDRGRQASAVGGPFSLTDQNGGTVTSGSLVGAPFLVFFGFTHCPDICPTKLFEISEIFRAAGQSGKDLRALFVTVDPERDTAEVMKSYLGSFDPRIVGITGSRQEIDAMVKAYRAYYRKVPTSGDDYTMDHTAIVYLMGKDGSFVGAFNVETSPEQAAAELLRQL